MSEIPSPLEEPRHPEVTEAEFEAASDDTKEKLFTAVEAKAKSGATEDIGADEPGYVIHLALPNGTGNIELFWNPDLPAEGDLPAELTGGQVVKTEYTRGPNGEITGAVETRYILDFAPGGRELSKEIDEGFTPEEDDRLRDTAGIAQEEAIGLTDEQAAEIASRVRAKMGDSSDFIRDKQAELALGLGIVSDAEAKELIELIDGGTPLDTIR